jgi:hypothetical protein
MESIKGIYLTLDEGDARLSHTMNTTTKGQEDHQAGGVAF